MRLKQNENFNVLDNKEVARKRGAEWREKLKKGRLEAQMFPSKLKIARVDKMMSQTEVARLVGLTTGTYGQIERGKRHINAELVPLIAKLLRVQPRQLFQRDSTGKYKAII